MGDKVRTIYNWLRGGSQPPHPEPYTGEDDSPDCPGLCSCPYWLHEANKSPPTSAHGLEGLDQDSALWKWPSRHQQWILLKADVTKAPRRVKILPHDWKYQVAELQDEWLINKVGTYGMGSAQLYWGEDCSLILRLLYKLFPQIDWGFVFVDDFCWILRMEEANHMATSLLATLVALRVALSWKKTHLAEVNTWLGFVIHPNIPQVQMTAPKHSHAFLSA